MLYQLSYAPTRRTALFITSFRHAFGAGGVHVSPGEAASWNKRVSRTWGCSSAGRAPALQAGGQGFEPPHLQIYNPLLGLIEYSVVCPKEFIAAIAVSDIESLREVI